MDSLRVGVDIGGTFTDIVVWANDGEVVVKKVSSSVDDYARAIIDGLNSVFDDNKFLSSMVKQVRHGTNSNEWSDRMRDSEL